MSGKVEVTRADRDQALGILWGTKGKSSAPSWLLNWVETGESRYNVDRGGAIAQAIADARAASSAEVTRLQGEMERLKAPTVASEELEADIGRLRDVLQTAVLPLGRTRKELVAMLDRIAAALGVKS